MLVLANGNIACSGDTEIKIYDFSGKVLSTLSGHGDNPYTISQMVVLPNSDLIASGSSDATIKIWNSTSGTLVKNLVSSFYGVFALAVLPNGFLASTSPDSYNAKQYQLSVWDLSSYSVAFTLSGHSNYAISLDVLKDGGLVSSSSDGIISWNITSKSLKSYLYTKQGANVVKVLTDGSLAAALANFSIVILNPQSGSVIHTLNGHTTGIYGLAELANTYLVSVSDDKTIRIWNIKTGYLLMTISGHTGAVMGVAVQNDYLLTLSSDGRINIWI